MSSNVVEVELQTFASESPDTSDIIMEDDTFSNEEEADELTPLIDDRLGGSREGAKSEVNPKCDHVHTDSSVDCIPLASSSGTHTPGSPVDEESHRRQPRRILVDVDLRAALYAALLCFTGVTLPADCFEFVQNRHLAYLLNIDTAVHKYVLRWFYNWFTIADFVRIVAVISVFQLLTGLPSNLVWLSFLFVKLVLHVLGPRGMSLLISFAIIWHSPYVREVIYHLFRKWAAVERRPICEVSRGLKKRLKATRSHDWPSPTHPVSSATRNNAFEQILELCSYCGFEPYFILMTRRLLTDNRSLHGAPTLQLPELDLVNDPYAFGRSADNFDRNSAIVLIDRDYYIDMNEIFMLGVPVILYTFDPILPCYRDEELEFTFDPSGKVIGKVQGGRDWNHFLWNYPDDMLYVSQRSVLNVYKVLRYRCDDMRSIIFFYPLGSSFAFSVSRIERISPVHGHALVMIRDSTTLVSIAGSHEFKEIGSEVWEDLVNNVRSRSTITSLPTVALHDVEVCLAQHKVKEDGLALFLWNVLKCLDFAKIQVTLGSGKSDFGISTEKTLDRVTGFQNLDDNGDGASPYDSTGMCNIASPLVQAGGAEERTLQNTATAITQRCTDRQEEADLQTEVIPDDLYGYAGEFVDKLLAGKKLRPYDEEVVASRMNKPGQKADRKAASTQGEEHPSTVMQFQKVEHYSQPNDPRNITTEKGLNKEQFARYTYPIADMLKEQPWYAFGRSCPEVAQAVAEICVFANDNDFDIAETDYVRYDGTVSAFTRWFVSLIYRAAYDGDEVILHLMTRTYNRWVLTSDFLRYFCAYSLLSGVMDTSIIGTCFNAYVGYSALRRTGLTPTEAWRTMGLYGGDDGIAPLKDVAMLERTARDVGLNLEVRVVERPALRAHRAMEKRDYPTFLARVYGPGVWYGDSNSCCDLLRTLPKFGITEKSVPHKATRLWEKAYAASLNDANTPILGIYATTIVTIAQRVMGQTPPLAALTLAEFYSKYDRTVNHWGAMACVGGGFPNFDATHWMLTYAEFQFPELCVSVVAEDIRTRCGELVVKSCSQEVDSSLGRKALKALLHTALLPFQEFPTYFTVPLKVKPGATVLVTSSEDSYVIRDDSAPNRTPIPVNDDGSLKSFKPCVRADMVEAYTVCHDVKTGKIPTPFPEFQIGARKCMYVATRFVSTIKKKYKPRDLGGCQIVYTGAFSNMTSIPIAKLFNAAIPNAFRFHFVDPAFSAKEEWIKELRALPKVTVRTVPYTNAMFEKVFADASKYGKKNLVFWLDDAFSDKGEEPNEKYMEMKTATLNLSMSNLDFSCIKFRQVDKPLYLACARTNVNVYHTPRNSLFFSDVTEHRLEVFGSSGTDECTISHSEKCSEIDQAIALRELRLIEQSINSWTPPSREDKSERSKAGGDKGLADRQYSTRKRDPSSQKGNATASHSAGPSGT